VICRYQVAFAHVEIALQKPVKNTPAANVILLPQGNKRLQFCTLLFFIGMERKMCGIGSQLLVHHQEKHKRELLGNGMEVKGVCFLVVF